MQPQLIQYKHMSHITIIFSPPGTPVTERTVGELVAESPSRSRVFEQLGIDYCCQGGRTLADACSRKGIDPNVVVSLLDQAERTEPDGDNPAMLSPVELIRHIVDRHHSYLRREVPRLKTMAARVADVHGGHTQSLVEVSRIFHAMAEELASHIVKEEQVLFPAIEAMCVGGPPIPVDGPVACMIGEHDDAGGALARLREITNGYVPPPDACNTYRALFAGLAELEGDLHRHIHLENSVLFPQALAMADVG